MRTVRDIRNFGAAAVRFYLVCHPERVRSAARSVRSVRFNPLRVDGGDFCRDQHRDLLRSADANPFGRVPHRTEYASGGGGTHR
ncbi:hypothetical protein SDC9_112880 [bioreactor metagenome]|uniref:Uncharacterized protein n=1 Tax=bioreactor metagenome TaxID=1076179 RepID=A0A645BL32_9ZZZZ